MILAHLGGIPLEESLIYLVPPLAVVVCIYVLGRRGHDDLPADDDLEAPPPPPLSPPPPRPPDAGRRAEGGTGGGEP